MRRIHSEGGNGRIVFSVIELDVICDQTALSSGMAKSGLLFHEFISFLSTEFARNDNCRLWQPLISVRVHVRCECRRKVNVLSRDSISELGRGVV